MIFLRNDSLNTERKGKKMRYLRETINGSNANDYSHIVEIKIFFGNQNLALNKPVKTDGQVPYGTISSVNNGNTNTDDYCDITAPVIIDLGAIELAEKVIVWHYWGDGRKYNCKTEISEDGQNWTTIFDSAVSGTYVETSQGKTHYLN